MTASEVAQLLTATALLIGAAVAYKKWRPERDGVTITNAGKVTEMSLSFAGEVKEDNAELREKIDRLEAELAQYRKDTREHITLLTEELRGKVAEVKHLETEVARRDAAIIERDDQIAARDQQIKDLGDRVEHLESEVRDLRNGS